MSKAFTISRKTAPTMKPRSRAEYHSLVTCNSVVVVEWPDEILTAMGTEGCGSEDGTSPGP